MSIAEALTLSRSTRAAPGGDPARRQAIGAIERRFDVPFVSRLALKEKQIQQNVRPVIAVHKWFARRPGTLFRALLLAEFGSESLRDAFYRAQQLSEVRVADPFMGGGTPLLEANRAGCDIAGWDVNPMAWWIVGQELASLDVTEYRSAAERVAGAVEEEMGGLYRTRCSGCGSEVPVKYFLWVKTRRCCDCDETFDLFPGYLVAAAGRHPRDVLVCAACGELAEVADRHRPGDCASCGEALRVGGPARRNRCRCPTCGGVNSYAEPGSGPPMHRMIAIEYHCAECQPAHQGRFFKRPDADDLGRHAEATRRMAAEELHFAPDEEIPEGDETARLHRWGYRCWRDLFNPRQLLGLETIARRVSALGPGAMRDALATTLSDLLRYQNMLCRYDTRSLKSLDVFSVHGFPVGLVQCESNLLGLRRRSGGHVGSGGWANIVDKYAAAKRYCERPFEVAYEGRSSRRVWMDGESIGLVQRGEQRCVELHCASAADAELEPGSFDAVLTDPPYLANVQYAELMDFCYVWLRRLLGEAAPSFSETSTKRRGDLTGNQTQQRGLEEFTAGLSEVFHRFAKALVPGGPFVFTYHHNDLSAYLPVIVALLDAGLVGTATLPCPAEMGGSIHIHRSGSSILDSVFVCRTQGVVPRRLVAATTAAEMAALLVDDLALLRRGGVEPTRGDARCLFFGHLARLAVWRLRHLWDDEASWARKLALAISALDKFPVWEEILPSLSELGERDFARRATSFVAEPPNSLRDIGPRYAVVEFAPILRSPRAASRAR